MVDIAGMTSSVTNAAYNLYDSSCEGWQSGNSEAIDIITENRDTTAVAFGVSEACLLIGGAVLHTANFGYALALAALGALGLQTSIGLHGLVCQRNSVEVLRDIGTVSEVFEEAPRRNYDMAAAKAIQLYHAALNWYNGDGVSTGSSL